MWKQHLTLILYFLFHFNNVGIFIMSYLVKFLHELRMSVFRAVLLNTLLKGDSQLSSSLS